MADNATNGGSNSHHADRGGTMPPTKAPMPHINDLVAIPRDIDSEQSIKRLLDAAEASLGQAVFSRAIKPASAFKDYIRAYIIALQIIPDHRDYLSMKDGQGSLFHAHKALLRKLDALGQSFEDIKKTIQVDNIKTGVKPAVKVSPNSSHRPAPRLDAVNRTVSSTPNAAVRTERPVPQPKPRSLQSSSISRSSTSMESVRDGSQDLSARFAELRGPKASPGQDPRIKTHPLPPTKPAGPRAMPNATRPKIGIDSSVPGLPRMPDAIYSPKGNSTNEGPRRSSTSSRGPFQRTGSSTSISNTRIPGLLPQTSENYPSSPIQQESDRIGWSPRTYSIAESEIISPEELYASMKQEGAILVIDIRTRNHYEEGHILWSSIICIEPEILLRGDPTAEDLEHRLYLSNESDHSLFQRRNRYDLVVYYDQNSTRVPSTSTNSRDLLLMSLQRALVDLNIGCELKRPPLLLKGGLDGWVDLMGQSSLQSTNALQPKLRGSLGTNPITHSRRKSSYATKPLNPDDAQKWQEKVSKDIKETEEAPSYVRSEADFVRRYPSLSNGQESMTGSTITVPRQRSRYGSSHQSDLKSELPTPPSRPAATLSRPSYSGFSEATDDGGIDSEAVSGQTSAVATRHGRSTEMQATEGKLDYTGLNNPESWCYANSVLQSLLASDAFAREFIESEWQNSFRPVPRKAADRIDPPQLLIQIMSNLFHWMNTGKFSVMKAKTLMDYSLHLSKQAKFDTYFGGKDQQDAQEFMSFLFDSLHDETNMKRDKSEQERTMLSQPLTSGRSLIEAANEYWQRYSIYDRSIIDRYWRGIDVTTTTCLQCKKPSRRFEMMQMKIVGDDGNADISLRDFLRKDAFSELDEFQCDNCKAHTKATQTRHFGYLPSHLCISFKRMAQGPKGLVKSTTKVTWNVDDFDFSEFFLPGHDSPQHQHLKFPGFKGPFRYQCYAVILHSGTSTNSGHYWSYVRDMRRPGDRNAWLRCEDAIVKPIRVDEHNREKLFKEGTAVVYMAFFRRINA